MRQLKIVKSITNRESQSLDKYLLEIGKLELLDSEDEASLALKIKQGDQAALDKLTKANLRFVVSVAKQYQNQGLSLPDLINEGNVGLIKAAHRFDETKGFKFISYAVWWIRQSILQSLADQARIVRLPLNRIGLSNKINKAHNLLEQKLEREPSVEEIAHFLEMDKEEIASSINFSSRHLSMDQSLGDSEENGTLLDILANPNVKETDNELQIDSLKLEINRSLSILTERQKEVISFYFGINTDHPLSLEDIAERFHLTRERVRQIRDNAICKLRTTARRNILKPYLGMIS